MKESKNITVGKNDVRVRFAPSPTGYLHVGGVRTALFNYLYARHVGGKFLLRIEDTDKRRSTPDAIKAIFDGLDWLGLTPDEEPVYQSERIKRHIESANKLLETGSAYRCFCTPEEITRRREASPAENKIYMYDRQCLSLTPQEIKTKLANDDKFAVRLKIPDGEVQHIDGIHGEINVSCREIDDFILLRRDSTPTYMLAVVVDDADMKVTHIIRGDDHISNTPKQILLYKALGFPLPEFAHLPLILGPDKKRLSKRHGATSVIYYRNDGYLVETMINYIGLLGWSPGDDRDIISYLELIDLFDITGIQSKGAVFDEKKLRWLNGQYIGSATFADHAEQLIEYAKTAVDNGELENLPTDQQIEDAWNLLHNRIHFLKDLFTDGRYLFQDPDSYDAKGIKKHFRKDGVCDRLSTIKDDFIGLTDFNIESIEGLIRVRAEQWEVSAGKIIHPLRLACSGVTGGPGLFEMLEVLGKDVVCRRLENAVKWIEIHLTSDR
ncbi:MAG: glutamate--tRNA ligase [Calditrichaeota bacterium]|nr:glutamate--tRNA ligase [Calditrichota bacterium]